MSPRPLAQQAPLFAVVGVLATITHYVAALIAHEIFGLTPFVSNFVGYFSAVGITYFGNSRLVFRTRAFDLAQFVRFVVVSLTGLAMNQALTWLLVEQMGWPFRFALCLILVVVPAMSFVLSRAWAFRHPA